MPELTVKLGDQTLQTCRFDGELLRIGRSRENDVVLENLSVSRHHAQLRFHEGRFILTDMNSANGTMVNGVKVTKTEVLDDDVITIGKHKLYFRQGSAAAVDAADLPSGERPAQAEPRSEAWLEVESGRLKGRQFKITRFETSLGKAPSNDIVLTDDWLLGKKQAIILRKGNYGFEIHDLGGLRRVKVNGVAASERVEIKDGDRIEMGGTALLFRATGAPSKGSGNLTNEVTAENAKPAGKRRSAQFSKTPVEGLGIDLHKHAEFADNESLDLEDDYDSQRILLKNLASAPPPEALSSPNEAESAEDEGAIADVTMRMPVPDVEPEPVPEPVHGPEPDVAKVSEEGSSATVTANPTPPPLPASSGNGRHSVFDDSRSSGRRKRKHHQRAAQKQEGTGSRQKSTVTGNQAKHTGIDKAPTAPSQVVPDEKEIEIWEAALKNVSPAIRRQAARTLKKLTGRDYEV